MEKSYNNLSVLHTVGTLSNISGGPPLSVTGLCEALGALGINVNIVSQSGAYSEGTEIIPNPRYVMTHFAKTTIANHRWRIFYSPSFKGTVADVCEQQRIRIIHDNGIWEPYNLATVSVARSLKIPLVIQPRGTLTPWALGYRAWKKRLAWFLYQKQILARAALLVATSAEEAYCFRAVGLRNPIAVIPNGIKIPKLREKSSFGNRGRNLLFMSRIHPKKGLLNLVAAWKQVRPQGWKIIVAGREENGHSNEVKTAISQKGLEDDFQFVGLVERTQKEQLFRQADLFILPTFSENFGVAVAEALSYGLPVITTTGAPWQGLIENRCGWWVEPAVGPIANAIQEAISLSDLERNDMGKRGRAFVERGFSWSKIASEMLEVYEWILGVGPKPDCILVN